MENNFGRNTVQPIRDMKQVEDALLFLKRKYQNINKELHPVQFKICLRNYFMFYLGINVGLRITDLLHIKTKDIINGFIQLRERKTRKIQQINMNKDVQNKMIKEYIKILNLDEDAYLFESRKGYNNPITRQNAYIVLQDVSKQLKWKFPVGTHTLRKTFGYHYYKRTNDIVGLQRMFNHRDSRTTLIYIGMIQEEVDKARKEFRLI